CCPTRSASDLCEGQTFGKKTGPVTSGGRDLEGLAREEAYWNNKTNTRRQPVYDWQHRDDPCYPVYYQSRHFAATNLMGSDLGMIVKKAENKNYLFFTTNLLNTKEIGRAHV